VRSRPSADSTDTWPLRDRLAARAHLPGMTVIAQILAGIMPDFDAIAGTAELRRLVGALMTYALLSAALMLIVSATTWALATHSGNWHTAQKAKTGTYVAIGGAVLTGSAITWANWLLGIGAHL
jgi:hypothetical protein